MKSLLDTHFLIWITLSSTRLRDFPWLGLYLPWGVSPVSLLELQYLSEIGRLNAKQPEFTDVLIRDQRFVVDDGPVLPMVRTAFSLQWTRDPFDRLLAAHSLLRQVPFCTVDRNIQANHPLIPPEIRTARSR